MHELKIAIFGSSSFDKIRWDVSIHVPNSVCHFPEQQSHRPDISGRHFFESLATKRITRQKVFGRGVEKCRLARKDGLRAAFVRVFADWTSVSATEIADTAKTGRVDLKER